VAGLVYAERKYGKLGLKRVMAPAIKLAGEWVCAHRRRSQRALRSRSGPIPRLETHLSARRPALQRRRESSSQPELARTLERIAADPDDFYHGKMAHELIDELKKGGALLTLDDLAQYTVVERAPITGSFHNYTILSAPPPSSGGIVLVSALNILEGYDLAKLGDRTARIDAPDRRGLSPRLHGPLRLSGRSGLQPIPVAELIAKNLRGRVARGILASAAAQRVAGQAAGFLPPAPTTAGRRRA
jgi:gamma-glutamyltranspeptidase/glutathione hydrolase